jgi:hypothetical protein
VLPEISLGSSNVADLDKDGYLDLVFGAFVRDPKTDKVVIRYGSPEGIDHGRRIVLPISGSCIGAQIADFNRDDWLDIAVTSSEANVLRIFWGSAAGFSEERQATLPAYYSISLETADLDNDGYLDLLVSGFEDRVAVRRDLGVTIYWGSAKGFHWWKTSWLPGFNIVGITVADFDADGYLDVFAPSYIGELTREAMPSYIYWGGPEGFGPRKRTILITDSASDGMAGDFDHDGLLDLAVSCHSRDGDHHTNSKVFYNDGKRFSAPRIESLPTKGTHFMWDQDIGHIYHRRNEQVYESSIKNWDGGLTAGSLHYQADIPAKARLTLQIRSASAPSELPRRQWRAVNSDRFAVSREDRCLQYRAIFESDNGDSFPTLDKVSLSLDP